MWLAALLRARRTGYVSKYKNFLKPGTPPLRSTRELDEFRERIRCMHYSLSSEQVDEYWARLSYTLEALIDHFADRAGLSAWGRWLPLTSE